MTNLIKTGHIIKAHGIKPLINFTNVMRTIKTKAPLDILSELPNTHSCDFCGKQVPLSQYVMARGKRYCSDMCNDMVIERNPIDHESDDDLNQQED